MFDWIGSSMGAAYSPRRRRSFLSVLACLADKQRPEIAVYRDWFDAACRTDQNVLRQMWKVSNLSAHVGLEVPAVVRHGIRRCIEVQTEGVPGRAFTYKADVTCQFIDNTESQKITVSACAYCPTGTTGIRKARPPGFASPAKDFRWRTDLTAWTTSP